MSHECKKLVTEHRAEIEDLRESVNPMHIFSDILVITIWSAIQGADDWVAVEEFGRAKQNWLGTFLGCRRDYRPMTHSGASFDSSIRDSLSAVSPAG